MKKALLFDAVGMIDYDLLESYAQMDQRLRGRRNTSKTKRYLVTLLAAAIAMMLTLSLLITSLPMIYVFNAEKINAAVSEGMESILFPLDKETEDGEPITPEDLLLNWVEWRVADRLFTALGAGEDDSVIDQLQSMQGSGLAGESMQSLGDFLARLYEYYRKYKKITKEEYTEDESTEDSTEEITEESVQNSTPTKVEENGLKFERSENQDYWTVTKIYSSIELKDNLGVLEIPELVCDLPVRIIGEKAAFTNELLQVLHMPQSITEVETNAFYGCVNLESVVFSENLTKIGESAFYQCGIVELILPDSVTRLEDSAFSECVNLQKVKLSTGATTISSRCFEGCVSLSEIIIPDTYTRILSNAFQGCISLQSIVFPRQLQEIQYVAFANSGLISVEVPDNVTVLGQNVFRDCTDLVSAKLPDHIDSIPIGFFSGCSKLEQFEIPSSCQEICGEAFGGCTSLERIELHDGIIEIQANAFYNCTSLKQFEFPKRLKTISYDAFYGCISLESVILPENLEEIGARAFMGCVSIRELYLPQSLKVLGARAFEDCKALITLEIPNQIEEFGESVFANCESLQSANLPTFGSKGFGPSGLFSNCVNLSSITLELGLHDTHIFYAMFSNTGIEEIVIPDDVGIIEDRLFQDCVNLKTVYLSKKTYRIHENAFIGCEQLSHIHYPGTVAEFGNKVLLSTHSIESGVIIVCTDGEIIIE